MPFFLDGNPTPGEISEAVNYVLANLNDTVVANQVTGQIVGPSGEVTGYLYKYISVKYADSFDGTVNFSNTPTNRLYYGIRNSDSSVESTNPADYVWNAVTGGFSTTKFLYYITTGGRTIQFAVATAVPNTGWFIDPGIAIDLDFTTASSAVANFVVIRVPNNSAAPTDAECIAAIGRTPISGDLCTVNYNSGIFSITYKYTTGWAIFQKYITGDLIVANSIVANNMAANSITAANAAIADATITTAKIGSLQVSTLKIADDAVSIASFYSWNVSGADNTVTISYSMAYEGEIIANIAAVPTGAWSFGSSSAVNLYWNNLSPSNVYSVTNLGYSVQPPMPVSFSSSVPAGPNTFQVRVQHVGVVSSPGALIYVTLLRRFK
jgi:hypothetical protein